MDLKCSLLRKGLATLSDAQLISFARQFDKADVDVYTWPLWGAAYVLCGGCSDDAFADFRATLISMGSEVYFNALADPNSLASVEFEGNNPCHEGYAYVLYDVMEERFGELPQTGVFFPSEPEGEEWNEDNVDRLYPSLKQLDFGTTYRGVFSNPRVLGLVLILLSAASVLVVCGVCMIFSRFRPQAMYVPAGIVALPSGLLMTGILFLLGGDRVMKTFSGFNASNITKGQAIFAFAAAPVGIVSFFLLHVFLKSIGYR